MTSNFGLNVIRGFFSVLDGVVYYLIEVVFGIFFQLSEVSIITSLDIEEFSSRIYVFLGILMLFKVTFSLITYLINPDAISDKAQGAGNIIKNIIITLFLIIIVPYAFNFMYRAQYAIIGDKIIPRIILGTDKGDTGTNGILVDPDVCTELVYVSDPGRYMAMMVFRPFYQGYDVFTSNMSEATTYCAAASVKSMLQYHKTTTDNDKYLIDYSLFFSTATGVVVLLLLLGFCFDIAMRSIKLAFLEIIAPIPIISFLDPKSSKNGMFKKWTQEIVNTWASLFIRIAIIYFIVYLMMLISKNIDATMDNGFWIMLFLVIGALMFAKKVIPMIENLLGIKFDHSIKLNPFKKIEEQAVGGKQLISGAKNIGAGTLGAAGGLIAGAKAGAQVGAAGRGALLGAFSGFSNGKSDPKHAFISGMNKTYKNMTGNEMNTLTPAQMLLNAGGKGDAKVAEVKDALKAARSKQNDLNGKLYQTQNKRLYVGQELENKYKLDTDNILGNKDVLKQQYAGYVDNVSKKKGEINSVNSQLSSLNTQIEQAEAIKNKDIYAGMELMGPESWPEEYRNAVSNLNEYNDRKNSLTNQKTSLTSELNNMESVKDRWDAINTYINQSESETSIRKELSAVEKDISTLSKEKDQRERFYRTDNSPTQSVNDTLKKYGQNQQNNS